MRIERIKLPEIHDSDFYPKTKKEEVDERLMNLGQRMREEQLTHIIVYGDREHYANLSYLTGGYDSRFEESLLIVTLDEPPILILGNEGFSYSDICLLKHKKELFQTFSLQGQVRDKKRRLSDIFKKCGLSTTSKVGIIGLKYYEENEVKDPEHTFDIPHYIIEELTEIKPIEQIKNVTRIMIHPVEGMRCYITHHEIARFEFMGNYLSNQMKKIIEGLTIGMSESEVLSNFDYKGIPFTVHPVVNFGTSRVLLGLASPVLTRYLSREDAISLSLVVEGASIARTGFAVASEKEFNSNRKNIINEFYFPYYKALKIWYEELKIGNQTKTIYDRVMEIIGDDKFGVTLNPGHQIHIEEWINSPFRSDYDFTLKSGMALQCDIIAFPGKPYVGVHVEDTVIIADDFLKNKLRKNYPETWKRIKIRQEMMKNMLGINIGKEVLPLSNLQAVLYPFLLNPGYIITAH